MSRKMDRRHYADMFGPTTGDRVRLGDTGLIARVEKDHTVYGDECKFGGDGLGEAGQRGAQQLGGGVHLALGGLAHLLELPLDRRVGLGAEDALEHLLALPGVGAQEAGEVALRQQHHLA